MQSMAGNLETRNLSPDWLTSPYKAVDLCTRSHLRNVSR